MSKYNELKAIVYVLKDAKAFDPNRENFEGLKAVDLLRSRKNEKNPYETNLQDICKLEPLLIKEDFSMGQQNGGRVSRF